MPSVPVCQPPFDDLLLELVNTPEPHVLEADIDMMLARLRLDLGGIDELDVEIFLNGAETPIRERAV